MVCLCGFMGCGKTTVGSLLARQLGWRFEDLDARIEERTTLTIPAIFEQMGEPAFRRIENEQLEAILGQAAESREPFILALGGGTYAQADHRVAGGDDPARIVENILALPAFQRLTGAGSEFSLRQVKT